MSENVNRDLSPKDTLPDIFRAAINNDVAELLDAIADGQKLSDTDRTNLNQTPVHFAAINSSNDFLRVAAKQESFDPWLRDDNERTAYDHANAHANKEGKQLLFAEMYGTPPGPDHRFIDTGDAEPSEFFPQ